MRPAFAALVASPARSAVLSGMVAALSLTACSASNGSYCDEDTPCEDPAFPYCDLTGSYGAKNACVRRQLDASPPDAPPMTDADSDPCAGVDCSDLTDDCNTGVCNPATGTCVVEPIADDQPCGAIESCTEFSDCSYPSTCGEVGVQSATCRAYTCQSGTCTASAPYQIDAVCNRETDGRSCGSRVYSLCGECNYTGGTCDETGSQTCTCTDYECVDGMCEDTSMSCTRACSRQTDGLVCNISPGGQQICCSASGSCNASCN